MGARRRSLIMKMVIAIPIMWIVLSTAFIFTDIMRLEDDKYWEEEPKLAVIEDDVDDKGVDKHDGRKLQSSEEQMPPKMERISTETDSPEVFSETESYIDEQVEPPPVYNKLGPGELGKPVVFVNLTLEQKRLIKRGFKQHAFNQYASDLISLHRSLPDYRSKGCKRKRHDADLPSTSVIICFHNEARSTLLRTVHSVLDRSPPQFLREIILVDDHSDLPDLGKPLEEYLQQYPKVKVLRMSRREGLIRARLSGAAVATAPVLTYLDSHCECTQGWLEPLLQRIADNWTAVVCPVIETINFSNFQYEVNESGNLFVGGFDWELQFDWYVLPEKEKKKRKHDWEPFRSPTMAGGLFSISKKFFERLGTYDDGFDIWGGENLELSFKTWMCGGTLEILPCSHVGHIFRNRSPYSWEDGINPGDDVLRKNSVRLAEVWMDEYKENYFKRIGNDLGDFGDVSSRHALRRRLNCKSFDWYLKNIYPDLELPNEAPAQGEIRNIGSDKGGSWCLDLEIGSREANKPVGLGPCHGEGGNQYWLLSKIGEIKRDKKCLEISGTDVVINPCHGEGGNQLWIYDLSVFSIQNGMTGMCMEMSRDKASVFMNKCNGRSRQLWQIENYDSSKLKNPST